MNPQFKKLVSLVSISTLIILAMHVHLLGNQTLPQLLLVRVSNLQLNQSIENSKATAGSECFRGNVSGIHMVIIPFLKYNKVHNTSVIKLLERENEYKHVLRKNLAHPQVQCVHILTTNSTETLATFQDIPHGGRMLVSQVESVDAAKDPFEYISQNLLGRNVMYASADVYLGAGFDRVDPVVMDKQKIMYALSRKIKDDDLDRPECKRSTYKDRNACVFSHFFDSHDIFLFRLHKPINDSDLSKHLDFYISLYGQENRIIWFFKIVLQYCVLNPCDILESYHYHCSDVRSNMYLPRIETYRGNRSARCPPGHSLTC